MNQLEIRQIIEQFGLDGTVMVYRDTIRILVGDQYRVIKKNRCSKERMILVNQFKKHLKQNNFHAIDCYYDSVQGYPYACCGDEIYVMTDFRESRECDFNSLDDVKLAVQTLAEFHQAAKGFQAIEGLGFRNEIGQLPDTLSRRTQELVKLKKQASIGKGNFENLYLKNADFFIEKCFYAMEIINSEKFQRLAKKANKDKEVCHKDYSFFNINIDSSGMVKISGLDYCDYEIRAYDIASFLRKIMSGTNWDTQVAMNVLNWYDTISKIGKDEMDIIIALLQYPQKFWRIANKYFNSRRTRPENALNSKLRELLSEKESYHKFFAEIQK